MRYHQFIKSILFLLLAGMTGCTTTGAEQRTPTLSYSTTGGGCSNIFVYVENADRTEALVIQVDRESIDISTTPRSFMIEQTRDDLDLHIDLFYVTRSLDEYCSDIGVTGPKNLQARWTAIQGSAEISVSADDVPFNTPYQTTLRLRDVVFVESTSERTVTLDSLTIENVTVGWLPG